ncbi:MAG: calcium/proton exchanger [Bacillota bacterium]|nr:calcium/proton exchanger [Bacillota bacterium]
MQLLNLLLLFLPVSLFLEASHAPAVWIFLTSALAILPLAALMGRATEEVSHAAGPSLGGFLSATFGNAAELILLLFALRAGLLELVKASITGAIISNLLLILGLSLLLGGLRYQTQEFNGRAAGVHSAMLFLAVIGLVLPAIFSHATGHMPFTRVEGLSLAVAAVLMATYVLSLLFSLRTHRSLFAPVDAGEEVAGPRWTLRRSLLILAATTVAVAWESEILVGSLKEVMATWGLTELFLGVIVIPLISNAAEHASAVLMAARNRMDLALSIAVGSSTQIALFVAPLLIFVSLAFGRPMTFIFNAFELAALAAAVLIANLISLDGETNWLEGVQLLAAYAIIGAAFYFI